MTPERMLALVWSTHAVTIGLITLALMRSAYRINGSPFEVRSTAGRFRLRYPAPVWPVAGRWLLSALFIVFTSVFIDIARVTLERNVYDSPDVRVTWTRVVIRFVPLLIEPWVFWRLWRVGLTTDVTRG